MSLKIFGENCISKDGTVNNLPNKTDCKATTTVKFKDSANNDYHLNYGDIEAIDSGKNLSQDRWYPFNQDIDDENIGSIWSIGSDYGIHKSVFSVSDTTDFIGPCTITIIDGIATFSVAQTGNKFGIGHKVLYGIKTCYLIEKITTSIWRVGLSDGLIPVNELIPVAVTNVLPVFNSLNSALDGATSGLYTLLGNSDNLINLNLKVEITCYNITDSSSTITSNTWITDKRRNIFLYVPTDTTTQCNQIQKFSGGWGNGYKLIVSSGNAFQISIPYTRINGFQVSSSDGIGIYCLNSENSFVANCIVKDCLSHGIVFNNDTPGINGIINNLVYDCEGDGILILDNSDIANDYYYVYNNNTIHCHNGFMLDIAIDGFTNIAIVKNHISQYNTLYDFNVQNFNPGHLFIEKSVSSDDTANKYENISNKINTHLTFNDYINKDFHLYFSDILKIGNGFDLTYDPIYPFNTDFDNIVRTPGYWSPGVDNFENTTRDEVFYSVGKNTSVFQSSDPKITIIGGLAYFDNPQVSKQIGIGDKVTYNTSDICYLAFKISEYIWRVVTKTGSKPSDITDSSVVTIKRAFNSLSEALTDSSDINHLNTTNLITAGVNLNLVCYDDGIVDDDPVTISGWTTDLSNQLKIYTPWNTELQSNKKNKHNGKWGPGYTIEPSTNNDAITINNDFVEINGIQINAYTGKYGIKIIQNNQVIIRDNIVKNASIGIYHQSPTSGNIAKIINNLVYDCTVSGIDVKYGIQYNNTVINSVIGYDNDITCTLKNNIGQNNSTYDFAYNSNIYNCLSKDLSAGSNNNCKSNIILKFIHVSVKDYHLFRTDTDAINKGLDLSSDLDYSFDRDIDNELIEEWSIGIDSPVIAITNLYFSVGQNLDDNKMGVNPKVTILDGIMTFSTEQLSTKIGIGDKVNYYSTGKLCYLKQKITTKKWVVVDKYGEKPSDIINATLNHITHTFLSLKSAIDGVTPGIKTIIETTDLSASKFNILVSCYDDGSADASSIILNSWITNKDNTLTIRPADNIFTECNKSQAHIGIYGTGYKMEISDNADALTIGSDNIIIDRIQIKAYTGRAGIVINDNENNKINNSIIKDSTYGINYSASTLKKNFIINNIVYDCSIDGIKADFNWIVYNNTIINCTGNGLNNLASTIVINTLCQDNGNDFLYNTIIKNCISSDSTAGSSNGCKPDISLTFVDKVNHNYNLAAVDTDARGVGYILTNDIEYPFDYDAINRARGLIWDVGALEFAAVKKVYYSVGQNTDNHRTGTPTITIVNGVATFTKSPGILEPQISPYLGVGDEVTYLTHKCYLKEKISDSTWYVIDKLGNIPADYASSVIKISHAFSSLRTALHTGSEGAANSSHLNTKNLLANGYQLNITCYDDGGIDSLSTEVSGWTVDDDCHINIYTPSDHERDCNISQRHKGIWGYGFKIVASTGDALKINGVDFTLVDGLQTKSSGPVCSGIHYINCGYSVITRNISKECNHDGIFNESPKANTPNYIVNNLTYKNNNSGIHSGNNGTAIDGITYIYNNTCVNNYGKGIFIEKGSSGNNYLVYEKNNLCQYNRGGDFIESNIAVLKNSYLYRCLSDDNTSNDYNGVENIIDTFLQFSNQTNNVYSLNVFNDKPAINSGLDLTADPNFAFHTDIIGRYRYPDLWDIGAFEAYPAEGTGEITFKDFITAGAYGHAEHVFIPTILYLRKNEVGDNIFHNLWDLSAFLKVAIFESYTIYVEGGETFNGTIDFGDRNIKSILIETDLREKQYGPATLVAATTSPSTNTITGGAPMISDGSKQISMTFRAMKLHMQDAYPNEKFVNNTANTEYIILENSIVQLNDNTIIDNLACKIEVVNSTLIYRNKSNSTILYLSKNITQPRIIANTSIITYNDVDMHFDTVSAVNLDDVWNCLFWNFGTGDVYFDNTNLHSCLTLDPLFIEGQALTEREFNISTTMLQEFLPRYVSPCKDAGNKDHSNNLQTDILGRRRISETTIDIGPYEVHIVIISFSSNKIKAIYQDKLVYNSISRIFSSLDKRNIYEDLPKKFIYDKLACEEYARESKLFIELKPATQEYDLIVDKDNLKLIDIEAYYDDKRNTIIFKKVPNTMGNLFNHIFEDGKYVFLFDEGYNLLSIYVNDTYNKGMSGNRNVVNNIRFGGPTLANI